MSRRTGTYFRDRRTRELLKPRRRPVEELELEPLCGAGMSQLYRKLFRAANRGDLDSFKRYVSNGARLDAKDTNGLTPFMWACAMGRENIFDFCVSSGIDINERDKFGNTALDIMIEGKQQATIKEMHPLEEKLQAVIDKLSALGAKCGTDMLAQSG